MSLCIIFTLISVYVLSSVANSRFNQLQNESCSSATDCPDLELCYNGQCLSNSTSYSCVKNGTFASCGPKGIVTGTLCRSKSMSRILIIIDAQKVNAEVVQIQTVVIIIFVDITIKHGKELNVIILQLYHKMDLTQLGFVVAMVNI